MGLLVQLEERERLARRLVSALRDLSTAAEAAEAAELTLHEACHEAGFATPDDARTGHRDRAAVAALESRVSTHQRRLSAVLEVLGEAGAEEALAAVDPDLGALEAEHAAAAAALGAIRSDALLWTARVARLTRLVADIDLALAAWAPVRAELELTRGLSAFVEGKSADNKLAMRLSAYVLAYRLAQVVAAANERLARMSDQRYSLEHTGQRGAGETRGGLSLLVRDDWSGESRDPATLSGGETFVVSLALALGLADVHHPGGRGGRPRHPLR